ncbi:unnamed protein product [Ectocarpus sp. 4 AP-2014]
MLHTQCVTPRVQQTRRGSRHKVNDALHASPSEAPSLGTSGPTPTCVLSLEDQHELQKEEKRMGTRRGGGYRICRCWGHDTREQKGFWAKVARADPQWWRWCQAASREPSTSIRRIVRPAWESGQARWRELPGPRKRRERERPANGYHAADKLRSCEERSLYRCGNQDRDETRSQARTEKKLFCTGGRACEETCASPGGHQEQAATGRHSGLGGGCRFQSTTAVAIWRR